MAPGALKDDWITSGQHDPVYNQIHDYATFPKQITGPTVWEAKDYRNNAEQWIHRWTRDELADIDNAVNRFIESGVPVTHIDRDSFRLNADTTALLDQVKQDLLWGKGFILFKGFPVDDWPIEKTAVAYMGVGAYLGRAVSQNGKGHVLGHVKDLGVVHEDGIDIGKTRIYTTTERQFFHVDDSDMVGLLCLARALEGGESDIVSSHHIFNVLQRERPDVVETFAKPIWYWDRKGEVSKGQKPYMRKAIFYKVDHKGQLYTKVDPYYVRSLTRFSDIGEIPPLSPAQIEALEVLEEVCLREALHMVLDVGDIQVVTNTHVLHARTAYRDNPAGKKRHLMRLWLSCSEADGGWPLPFPDTLATKRGGIQVDNIPEVCVLEAE